MAFAPPSDPKKQYLEMEMGNSGLKHPLAFSQNFFLRIRLQEDHKRILEHLEYMTLIPLENLKVTKYTKLENLTATSIFNSEELQLRHSNLIF